jgi:acyl-coenzyme A synthetase/AMP-(fatty) acid ligase
MINAFIQVGEERYYRSGDTASFEDGHYYCHGRKDDQVKIQGYRVELSEIEYAASNDFPTIATKAIVLENNIHLIIKTLQDVHLSDIEQSLNQKLPWYMRPKKIHFINEFPLNANGKIDKNALKEWIQSK